MSDYEKLTVVKLRDELVQRGLPKTGLKAALVQRLHEADAQSGSANAAPENPPVEKTTESAPTEEAATIKAPTPPALAHDVAKIVEDAYTNNDAPQAPQSESEVQEDGGRAEIDEATIDMRTGAAEGTRSGGTVQIDESPAQTLAEPPKENDVSEVPIEDSRTQQDTQGDVLPGVLTQPAQEPDLAHQLPTPIHTQPDQNTTLSVAGTEDLLEDSRKRKRRSQSPPPSSLDTQKRFKANSAYPHVELPEDTTIQDDNSDLQSDRATSPNVTSVQQSTVQMNGHAESTEKNNLGSGQGSLDTENVALKKNGAAMVDDAPSSNHVMAASAQPKNIESPIKQSSSDTRFKNLFSAPSKSDASAQQPPYFDTEERIIGPALHPATSALYIRELMRPLKPENVKDHLTALATPPDASIDLNIVTEFFLDSIRTHCLVGFASVSAASRVRSSLHDRIWPNERDRRPLYVDFVPEEKLKKWINVEQNAPSGRGQPQRRWEVVYEDENGAINAYLQEVGSNVGGLRATQPAKADAGQGVKGAPSGPRMREPEPQAPQPRADLGKGFKALDDLFKSTDAKPKLYYQPVSKAIAEQRLEKLAAGRGGGRSDEMRRYTFEDDLIVDKAPEFGNRGGRGGYGGRGGFSGSYRGRGGGYRGDGYRGGGDSWRDRRPGY